MFKKISLFFVVLSALGCSLDQNPPSSFEEEKTTGQYIDQGLDKIKRTTVETYRRSRDWIYDSGKKFSNGTTAFRKEWDKPVQNNTPPKRSYSAPNPNDNFSRSEREGDYGLKRGEEFLR